MRQVDSPLPNLGQSRGPGIGSKGWVPRNTSGRVGAFIIGALAVISALSMIAASYVLTVSYTHLTLPTIYSV